MSEPGITRRSGIIRCAIYTRKSSEEGLEQAFFGFAFEDIFRQHMIVKGRYRDTAWFAMLDHDWHRVRAGFERWLRPENFDEKGRQKAPLKVS